MVSMPIGSTPGHVTPARQADNPAFSDFSDGIDPRQSLPGVRGEILPARWPQARGFLRPAQALRRSAAHWNAWTSR
ncbi:hypothetical protein D8B29_00380 [Verminephrobacter eiseniae]|nr:hypothetical protein [Verminephrobacter eiseniae]MCW5303257.1 hypothetical protein [Verminephrobacter eiseniae]MCW8178156.1 hypothetical protein [Verminephrobacter eiseniae]MCW8188650.1 hypothetical protein [Verminephrobacter eiseniae]